MQHIFLNDKWIYLIGCLSLIQLLEFSPPENWYSNINEESRLNMMNTNLVIFYILVLV